MQGIALMHTLTPRAFTRTAQGATLKRLASTVTPAISVLKGSHSKLKILGSAMACLLAHLQCGRLKGEAAYAAAGVLHES